MKSAIALMGTTVLVCSLAVAQSSDDRVVVPARNTSRPRQVHVRSLNGSITVKAYDGKDVIVETGSGTVRHHTPGTSGMHRLDVPRGVTVEEDDNTIEVRNDGSHAGSLTISVPPDTSLNLHSLSGALTVEGVRGEIVTHTNNGRIQLSGVSGTVMADSLNGGIHVNMDKVDAAKPLSFSTLNGTIDVTVPSDLKANVKFKADHGEVFSDFEVTLGGSSPINERDSSGQGRYRVRFDRTLQGRINGGGVEITFHTLNGTIYLRKK